MTWPAVTEVRAAAYWNDTGILLRPDMRYDLVAEGRWIDLFICSGPEGNPRPTWSQRQLGCRLRAPDALYFTLIGALDRDLATIFAIGARRVGWSPPRAGQLTCFANDVPGFYWNNRGSVRLMVTPAASQRLPLSS